MVKKFLLDSNSILYRISLLFVVFIFCSNLYANDIVFSNESKKNIGLKTKFFVDKHEKYSNSNIEKAKFTKSENEILNFGVTTANIWVKFTVLNSSNLNSIIIEIDNPLIDEIVLYDQYTQISKSGEIHLLKQYSNNPFFELDIAKGETKEILLLFKSTKQLTIPISIENRETLYLNQTKLNLFIVFYIGIVLTMLFYNFFLYFSLKERVYLYYLLLIFFVGINQLMIYGYGSKFLYFDSQWLSLRLFSFVAILAGVFTILYTKSFTNSKKNSPIIDKIFNVDLVLYSIAFILTFFNSLTIVSNIIFILATTTFIIIIAGIKSYRSGNNSAKFFILAFSFFTIGVTIYAFRLYGIVPYNTYTKFALPVGSGLEIILLAFAQASKVSTLKKEKAKSDKLALERLIDKESLIRNQKENLEIEVTARTKELKESKIRLEAAYSQLKQTQQSRIEAEKMSSLGQLTAGIAHELNNPINFIANNVAPLRRDLDDILSLVDKYESCIDLSLNNDEIHRLKDFKEEIELDYLKEEIEILLKGIDEGSNRTAEIVHNLKIYSHLDSDTKQNASIIPGLRSTAAILQSNFKTDCEIKMDIPDTISNLYCLPGKLNQVFMNIINNAIHASIDKNKLFKDRYVAVSCSQDDDNVYVTVKDNGNGIPQEVLDKIFDPFFTTKKIGVGTGLGLSISRTIIESHQGEIKINTNIGNGTEFIVILPRNAAK